VIGLLALTGLGALLPAALYSGLTVREYAFFTAKLESPVRLMLLSDLHGCVYGENQSGLLGKIERLAPDAVAMAGDMLDERLPAAGTTALLSALSKKYPCYYVMGNHEVRKGSLEKTKEKLTQTKITVLDGKRAYLKAKSGGGIAICGADDPLAGKKRFMRQLQSALQSQSDGLYTVLISHRPELFRLYAKMRCDLVLAGHSHGGQWRVPFLINGVFAPHQGLLPKYAGGVYGENGVNMVVSRGLVRMSAPPIPRIFNPPELVVIDILPEAAPL